MTVVNTKRIMSVIMSQHSSNKEKMENAVHLALAVASGHRASVCALRRARRYGLGCPHARATIIIAAALADHYKYGTTLG